MELGYIEYLVISKVTFGPDCAKVTNSILHTLNLEYFIKLFVQAPPKYNEILL